MLVLTVALTAVVALALGLAPAKLARRRIRQCDLGWAAGLWLATWVFALCAYHRPVLTVGFDAFRLAAITALCGWASFCVAGLRSFGGRGLRFVVPLLLAAALGSEVFVGNVTYFNTHSYQPFQLLDYLDPNVNVIRGQGSISASGGGSHRPEPWDLLRTGGGCRTHPASFHRCRRAPPNRCSPGTSG